MRKVLEKTIGILYGTWLVGAVIFGAIGKSTGKLWAMCEDVSDRVVRGFRNHLSGHPMIARRWAHLFYGVGWGMGAVVALAVVSSSLMEREVLVHGIVVQGEVLAGIYRDEPYLREQGPVMGLAAAVCLTLMVRRFAAVIFAVAPEDWPKDSNPWKPDQYAFSGAVVLIATFFGTWAMTGISPEHMDSSALAITLVTALFCFAPIQALVTSRAALLKAIKAASAKRGYRRRVEQKKLHRKRSGSEQYQQDLQKARARLWKLRRQTRSVQTAGAKPPEDGSFS